MQKKTIEKVLSKKFDEWVNTITDEKVKSLVKGNSIITGGCITSMFLREPINDFDVYFTNKETTKAVAEYYVDIFNERIGKTRNNVGYKHNAIVIDGALPIEEQLNKYGEELWQSGMLEEIPEDRIKIVVRSDGVANANASDYENEDIEDGNEDPYYNIISNADEILSSELIKNNAIKNDKKKYLPVFLSTNAISLSDSVQLIIRFYGNPDEIHSNYDFTHCTNYWLSSDEKLYTNTKALECILSKTLFYQGSKYPLCSIIRTRKFLKRGWNINAGQYLKMAMQLNQLDLSDIHVLEDQLIGVDTLYFRAVIDALKHKIRDTEQNESIDNSYVVTLIDKVFGD